MRSLKWKSWKLWLLVLAGAFLAIQFVPVETSNPPVESDAGASAPALAILRKACYDCHSHETRWPWYSRIAPFSWLVADHVNEGRKELNFSRWGSLSAEKRAHKLEECAEQLAKGEMPPKSYLWLHQEARLNDADRLTLERWFASEGQ